MSGGQEQQRRTSPLWTLSVVSHGHAAEVERLLADLARHLSPERYSLVLTLNLGASERVRVSAWAGRLRVIENVVPRSFAANHNAALAGAETPWLAAIDPDLQLRGDPFPALEAWLARPDVGVVAPQVRSVAGVLEDHGRYLPGPAALVRRYLGGRRLEYPDSDQPRQVEWLAGLFMAFRAEVFAAAGGFDKRYRLYCEDVELCARLGNQGLQAWQLPSKDVIHIARRATLKKPRHFLWHCKSLVRFWRSPAFSAHRQRKAGPGA